MDKELTLVEHLEELRKRIIVSLIFIFTTSILAFPFARKVLTILKSPSSGLIERLAFFNPAEAFLIHIKISILVALVISMPLVLYQLWAFLSPAIEDKTRRYGAGFLISSIGAFICGSSFGFLLYFQWLLNFS